eukprot:scaffold319_cov362-Pavlova_lutheri.AAC.2
MPKTGKMCMKHPNILASTGSVLCVVRQGKGTWFDVLVADPQGDVASPTTLQLCDASLSRNVYRDVGSRRALPYYLSMGPFLAFGSRETSALSFFHITCEMFLALPFGAASLNMGH